MRRPAPRTEHVPVTDPCVRTPVRKGTAIWRAKTEAIECPDRPRTSTSSGDDSSGDQGWEALPQAPADPDASVGGDADALGTHPTGRDALPWPEAVAQLPVVLFTVLTLLGTLVVVRRRYEESKRRDDADGDGDA